VPPPLQLNYTERTTVRNGQQADAALSALYDAMEGAMPSVHAWRDEVGCDTFLACPSAQTATLQIDRPLLSWC